MQNISIILFIILVLPAWTGAAQIKHEAMTQTQNPLLCDPDTGLCALPGSESQGQAPAALPSTEKIRIIYFTDPICSACWGIEPQLRKLKLEYGSLLDWEYRMGGLLPDWSYSGGGISGPSDVAVHWDEAAQHYDMPIIGDVWRENPLSSSYPPSIAFKAAQAQDEEKAILFLRALRERLFLGKQNITEWEPIREAALEAGLDPDQLEKDYKGEARQWFNQDLELARAMGVRGFPTIFLVNASGQQERLYGALPYAQWEKVLHRLEPRAEKMPYPSDWQALFERFSSLSSREFAELSGTPRDQADAFLQRLHEDGELGKRESRNGPLWTAPSLQQ